MSIWIRKVKVSLLCCFPCFVPAILCCVRIADKNLSSLVEGIPKQAVMLSGLGTKRLPFPVWAGAAHVWSSHLLCSVLMHVETLGFLKLTFLFARERLPPHS